VRGFNSSFVLGLNTVDTDHYERISCSLGLIATLLVKLAKVYNIPLMHEIRERGSKSVLERATRGRRAEVSVWATKESDMARVTEAKALLL
jgi:hypothetical protein